MKRDIDLIKALLLSLEDNDAFGEIEGYSNQQVSYLTTQPCFKMPA